MSQSDSVKFRTLARDRRTWDGFCAFGWPRFLAWIFCRIVCRSLCQGFEFLFGRCSPKCAFRGPEVQKERPREPPRKHFSEPFRSKTKTRLCVFSEFISGPLFETFFRLFVKIWRPSNSGGHPFKAKTYWYLEISSFFQFVALFRKSVFSEFQDPEKEHPEAPRRHSSTSPSIRILKFCVFKVFLHFVFVERKR